MFDEELKSHESRLLSQGRSDDPMFTPGSGLFIWSLVGAGIMFAAYMGLRAFVL